MCGIQETLITTQMVSDHWEQWYSVVCPPPHPPWDNCSVFESLTCGWVRDSWATGMANLESVMGSREWVVHDGAGLAVIWLRWGMLRSQNWLKLLFKSAAFLLRMSTTLILFPPGSSIQFSLTSIIYILWYHRQGASHQGLHSDMDVIMLFAFGKSLNFPGPYFHLWGLGSNVWRSVVLAMEHVTECIQHMPNNWYCFTWAVAFIQATGLKHHEERWCLMSSLCWLLKCNKCVELAHCSLN